MKQKPVSKTFSFTSVCTGMMDGMKRVYQGFLTLPRIKKGGVILLILVIGWFGIQKISTSKKTTPVY